MDEDEEPALKFRRADGGLSALYAREHVSAALVSAGRVLVGTHDGRLLTFDGAFAQTSASRMHAASVLALDCVGEHVASASLDGRIVVRSLSDIKDVVVADHGRPVQAVALDPAFVRSRAFCAGGLKGELVWSTRGWFGMRDAVLFGGDGPITAISWRSDFVVWTNDLGIHVLLASAQTRIAHVARARDAPRADLYRPRVAWATDSRAMVGWANTVWIIQLTQSSEQWVGQVVFHLRLASIVCGLAPRESLLAVLLWQEEDDGDGDGGGSGHGTAASPELVIIEPQTHSETSADVLDLSGYANLGPNDYHLSTDNGVLYIFSAKDAVVGMERDAGDHVEYLIQTHAYAAALDAVEQMGEDKARCKMLDIGQMYMRSLVQEHSDYEAAGRVAGRVLGRAADAWAAWVFVFAEASQLGDIAFHVPIDLEFDSVVYELLMAYMLVHDESRLLTMVYQCPEDSYSIPSVIEAVKQRLLDHGSSELLHECLAELHMRNNDPQAAMEYLLTLRKPEALDLIKRYRLLPNIKSMLDIFLLFVSPRELATETPSQIQPRVQKALELLVDNLSLVPPQKTLRHLSSQRLLQYLYLEAVVQRATHIAEQLADERVSLYAEFDRAKLLSFLQTDNAYTFDHATRVCEARQYTVELVYILGKTGENKKALQLILTQLKDVEQAIAFAKAQDDRELWDELLQFSMDKPQYVLGLLQHVGTAIDPIDLIRRIPDGLEIHGLREGLVKILREYEMTASLSQEFSRVLEQDVARKTEQLRKGQRQALALDSKRVCDNCRKPIGTQQPQMLVVAFATRKIFHQRCLVDTHLNPIASDLAASGVGDKVTAAVLLRDHFS